MAIVELVAAVAAVAGFFAAVVIALAAKKPAWATTVAGVGVVAVVVMVVVGMSERAASVGVPDAPSSPSTAAPGVPSASSPASSPTPIPSSPPSTSAAPSSPVATPSRTAEQPAERTIRLAAMCQPGRSVDGLQRSARCPYTASPPVIGGAIFDPDAAKGPLTGGYYEHGNWALIIRVREHTCTQIDLEFGRDDTDNSSSSENRSWVKIITSAGSTEEMVEARTIGHLSVSVEESPFEILTSSDGGKRVFVKASLVCTSETGHP